MNIRLDQNGIKNGPEMNTDAGLYSRDQIQSAEKSKKVAGRDQKMQGEDFGVYTSAANGVNIMLGNKQNPGLLDRALGGNSAAADGNGDRSSIDLDNKRNYMMIMSTSVSDEELGKLQEEGFKPGEMKPEEIVTIVDEIKMQLAISGTVVAGYNDDLEVAQLEEMTGNPAYSNAIRQALSKYQLPETKQNVQQMTNALEQAQELPQLSDDAKVYLLQNDQEPTLQNMYLALHSGANGNVSGEGYYRAGNGYLGYQLDLQEQDLEALQDQIGQLLEQNDMEMNEENLDSAKWLLQNNLPLTEENMRRQKEMEQMRFPLDLSQTADAIARSIKDGEPALSAVPGRVESIEQKVMKLQKELETMDLETMEQGSFDWSKESDRSPADLDHHLQLEEARLRLTLSTGAYLLKNGISPDITNLEHLVEQLKEAQNQINEVLFGRGNEEENLAAAELWKETRDVVKAIPDLPAQTLGTEAFRTSFSLRMVYTEGTSIAERFDRDTEKALQSYETLMTAPRTDLGDSITKAFRNVDSLLTENGIEVNETNQKAARILAYNRQEITKENVLAVGEAYEKVHRVIRKMTPGATLSLIREKINPLEMNLEDLEQHLDQQEQSPEKDMEKYSRFLVRLEEQHKITPEERESYIGIYRMLYQIEKNEHASIGALLGQGGDLTFKNLLTNARNRDKTGMNVSIDDSFGFLEKTVSAHASITDQLLAAFDGEADRNYYKEVSAAIRSAGNVSTQAVELLEENHVKETTDHLLAAEAMLERPVGMFETVLFSRHPEETEKTGSGRSTKLSRKENRDAGETKKLLEDGEKDILENFTDAVNARQAYESFADRMQETLLSGIGRITDRIDLKEISLAMKQISLAASLAKEENYEIPMWFGDELASVNVRFVHTKEKQGKISIHTETEKFGMVHADFTEKEDGLDGFIVCDRREIMQELEERKDALPKEIRRIDFAQSERIGVNYFKQSADEKSKGKEDASDRERISKKRLYETAKAFLTLLHTNGN